MQFCIESALFGSTIDFGQRDSADEPQHAVREAERPGAAYHSGRELLA